MTRHRLFSLLVLMLAALWPVLALAGADDPQRDLAPESGAGADRVVAPDFHDASRDGPVFMSRDGSGELWAVWSFHSGLNVDVAISRAIGTTWSNPLLLGEGNGATDLDPRLEFLADGTGLLVWWQSFDDGSPSRVMMSAQVEGRWSEPEQVSADGVPARNPTIFTSDTGAPLIGYVATTPEEPSTIVLSPVPRQEHVSGPKGGTNGPDPFPAGNGRDWEKPKWLDNDDDDD